MLIRVHSALAVLLPVSAVVFLTGIGWGLPSAAVNAYLFGGHRVWTGNEIVALAGPTDDSNRGADVASHPSPDRNIPIVVNGDDRERARIVRRYRLMSYQPDEWNTLKALSEMKPARGDFDPKLYQYGGLWVYPVGALLKIAALTHLIHLRGDVAWYLDHPEEFGRFYIVARLWSVFWAIVGVAAIFQIVRTIVGGWFFPSVAAVCFFCMPVVVNMAHEAKPHMPGAVLMLLAVLAAARYVEGGARRAALGAGALCGAALGMVLSSLPIFCVLPAMVLLRPIPWRRRLAICASAAVAGITIYLIANPYVPFNFIRHRALLESNIANSGAMYHAQLTARGIANAAYLAAAGTSPVLAAAGVLGALALGIRAVRMRRNSQPHEIRRRAVGLLLAVPAACVMLQSIAFATDKPGEFGRFLLAADIFLAIEAVVAIATFFPAKWPSGALVAALVTATAANGFAYERAFMRDSRAITGRILEAARLRNLGAGGTRTMVLGADPAPYCMPPVDLFKWNLLLLPAAGENAVGLAPGSVSVRVVDFPSQHAPNRWTDQWQMTPISWADKKFDVELISIPASQF